MVDADLRVKKLAFIETCLLGVERPIQRAAASKTIIIGRAKAGAFTAMASGIIYTG